MAPPTAITGAGARGQTLFDQHQAPDGCTRHDNCWQRQLRQLAEDGVDVAKETALVDVYAQHLGQLIDNDHATYTRLKTGEYRVGNKTGEETESQDAGGQQHQTHQHREGRCRGEQCGVRIRSRCVTDRSRRQYRDGGCGGYAKICRGAQQRVYQRGDKRRVQTHLYRQSGNGGIGHGLGDHHRRSGQTCGHVGGEPVALVIRKPGAPADHDLLSTIG